MARSDELIISAYGSHNAAVSMYYKGKYTVVEVERWVNIKNSGLCGYNPVHNIQLVFDEICDYLLAQTDRSDVDTYVSGYMGKFKPKFFYRNHITVDHHLAHAAGAFYQSPYKESLVITFDGGGDGGFFNVYKASRQNGIELIAKFNQDLGFAYMILSDYLSDIKKEPLTVGNLVYAGKLMGLCSYGKVRHEWLPHFYEFYETFQYTGDSYLGGAEARVPALKKLFAAIGVEDFDIEDSRFEGQFAWDIAATTQRAFEDQFFKRAQPFIEEYAHLPLSLSGGCALNVLLNTQLLRDKGGLVFVPPNTNDCGISVGGILSYLAPEGQVDLTYSGLPVLDAHLLSEYVESGYDIATGVTIPELARYLADNHLVGVVRGNSEHGSRALGNRSILCNPAEGMKDTLNQKVKNREWYRPFAPMVRLDEANKYFDFPYGESRHMVFVAWVRQEWQDRLPAITHEDGTGRLQTVTRGQNEFIYDLLGEFGKLTGHSVLLNTSFNVNGKPILTKLSDALSMLDKTKLDAVYFNGNLLFKKGHGRTFDYIRKGNEPTYVQKDANSIDVTFYGFAHGTDAADLKKKAALLKKRGVNAYFLTDDEQARALTKAGLKNVESVTGTRHYHKSYLRNLLDAEPSGLDFANYLTPMWVKESIRDRLNPGTYQIVVPSNVSEKNLLRYVDGVIGERERVFVAKSISGWEMSKPVADYYRKKGYKFPDFNISPNLFAGTAENVIAAMDSYEATFLQLAGLGKKAEVRDLLNATYIENPAKYEAGIVL